MKLIFVKNLKLNLICLSIFNHLLSKTQKPRSLSYMREFKNNSEKLDLDTIFEIENIVHIINNYKEKTLTVEYSDNNKLIKQCLNNNSNPNSRIKLNLITYAGPTIFAQVFNNSI